MNSSSLSALNLSVVLSLLLLVGCGGGDGSAQYRQGEEAFAVRDLVRAEKAFAKACAIAPDNVDALVMLARTRLELGEIKSAGEVISEAAARAPSSVDVIAIEAEVAYFAADYDRAVRLYACIADDASVNPSDRSLAMSAIGVVEMARNNRDAARVALMRAIRTDRRNAAARYHLGYVYADGFGYQEAALEQFEMFVRMVDAADARVKRVQQKVIPGVREAISRSAMERPGAEKRDSAASAQALAKAEEAWKKGNFKTARSAYEEALKCDVLSYPAALGYAKALAKTDVSEVGRRKTLEAYRTACALRYGATPTYITAGTLAVSLGQHATAVEIYSRALAAEPANITIIDSLIRALRKAGGKGAESAALYQNYRDYLSSATTKRQ